MNSGEIEVLVQKVQAIADAEARETALELVQAIMDFHAAGLARVMELIAETGGPAMDAIAGDDLAGSILLLHDLHPLDMRDRVLRALDRPEFRSHGVGLVSVDHGVIDVHIEGGPELKAAVEAAVTNSAPDASAVVVEGGSQSVAPGFVPLESLMAGHSS